MGVSDYKLLHLHMFYNVSVCSSVCASLGVIKSMLTHTYLHKALRKIKANIFTHQADSQLYVWPDVWSSGFQV